MPISEGKRRTNSEARSSTNADREHVRYLKRKVIRSVILRGDKEVELKEGEPVPSDPRSFLAPDADLSQWTLSKNQDDSEDSSDEDEENEGEQEKGTSVDSKRFLNSSGSCTSDCDEFATPYSFRSYPRMSEGNIQTLKLQSNYYPRLSDGNIRTSALFSNTKRYSVGELADLERMRILLKRSLKEEKSIDTNQIRKIDSNQSQIKERKTSGIEEDFSNCFDCSHFIRKGEFPCKSTAPNSFNGAFKNLFTTLDSADQNKCHKSNSLDDVTRSSPEYEERENIKCSPKSKDDLHRIRSQDLVAQKSLSSNDLTSSRKSSQELFGVPRVIGEFTTHENSAFSSTNVIRRPSLEGVANRKRIAFATSRITRRSSCDSFSSQEKVSSSSLEKPSEEAEIQCNTQTPKETIEKTDLQKKSSVNTSSEEEFEKFLDECEGNKKHLKRMISPQNLACSANVIVSQGRENLTSPTKPSIVDVQVISDETNLDEGTCCTSRPCPSADALRWNPKDSTESKSSDESVFCEELGAALKPLETSSNSDYAPPTECCGEQVTNRDKDQQNSGRNSRTILRDLFKRITEKSESNSSTTTSPARTFDQDSVDRSSVNSAVPESSSCDELESEQNIGEVQENECSGGADEGDPKNLTPVSLLVKHWEVLIENRKSMSS